MKCSKCKCENIISANYCRKCGEKFSDEEKKIARRKTWVGKLELLEEARAWCTLEKITGHIVFKIVSLLAVILFGVYLWTSNSNHVKILESKHYKVQYNTKEKEYYLLVDEDKTNLSLYVPNTVSNLVVSEFDEDNVEVDSTKYVNGEEVVLTINNSDEYYLLVAKNGEKDEKMKIHVYRIGD